MTVALAVGADLKRDEEVIFFPTVAWRVTNGWELEIPGWVFEPEKRKLAQSLFRRVVGLDEGEMRAAEKATPPAMMAAKAK